MKPFTAGALALLFLLGPALTIAAEASAPSAASATYRSFEQGDQTIGLAAGVSVPLFTFGGDSTSTLPQINAGGAFSFTYQYFISHGLAIGGTLTGSFNKTLGGRNLFFAPLTFRTAYWWNLSPFELALVAEVGAYISRVSGEGMIGPFFKLGAAADWRVSQGWSIGVQASYWFVPEIHAAPYANLTRFGNFLETAITASYHL